jgi:hypothetical protein
MRLHWRELRRSNATWYGFTSARSPQSGPAIVLLAGFWFALSAPGERTPQMQSSPPTHTSPASAGSAYPSEPNTPALVAFTASLIFPLAVALDVLAVLIVVNRGPYILQSAAILVGGMVSVCGLPATACAIICGHIAYVSAKRYPPAHARRWMAGVSLLLGYVSLAGWAVFFVLLSLGYFRVRHANLF